MISIKRILLPVDIPVASLSVINEAAILARRFNSEIIMLHVMTMQSHTAGVPEDPQDLAGWDLLAAVMKTAEHQHNLVLGPHLQGLKIQRRMVEGDAAVAIVRAAQEEKADLIVMPSHSFTFSRFLLGSVTAKVLHGTECPVWTGAHAPESASQDFVVRNVLAAVEFGTRAEIAVSWATQLAAEFGARLTLANCTPGVEFWGPGGNYVNTKWRDEIVGNAREQMASLQRQMGTKAEVFIGSGDVPKVLAQAVQETKADLLVSGCYPYGGQLRTHGYGIICAVPVPVLSV